MYGIVLMFWSGNKCRKSNLGASCNEILNLQERNYVADVGSKGTVNVFQRGISYKQWKEGRLHRLVTSCVVTAF